ncbi:hypothetical protein [Rhodococcus sp. Q]|uniref:hypothetical protein n=1 Tax=Rhodococcus sp. Q TaxID=2502252 RepID=UPI0010F6BC32|nr:hypothetical protein [Rhodococcus sp. Q]
MRTKSWRIGLWAGAFTLLLAVPGAIAAAAPGLPDGGVHAVALAQPPDDGTNESESDRETEPESNRETEPEPEPESKSESESCCGPATLVLDPNEGTPGTRVSLSAYCPSRDERLTASRGLQLGERQISLDSAFVGLYEFTAAFVVPELEPDTYEVSTTCGGSAQLTVVSEQKNSPLLSLDPTEGRPGSDVAVSASGLPDCEPLWTVLFDGTDVGTFDMYGSAPHSTFTVPDGTAAGQRTVRLECRQARVTVDPVDATFTVVSAGGKVDPARPGTNVGTHVGGGTRSGSIDPGTTDPDTTDSDSLAEEPDSDPSTSLVAAAGFAAMAVAGVGLLDRKRRTRNRLLARVETVPHPSPPTVTVESPTGDAGSRSIGLDARSDTGYQFLEVKRDDYRQRDDN